MARYDISLYVHVPFCLAKCGYCGFCSYPSVEPGVQLEVARRTVRQAQAWASELGGLDAPTVYIGGGTPSVLAPDTLEELLGGLARIYGNGPGEVSIEANPESLTPAFLDCCSAHGIGRLSLGVQTFSAARRAAVGRRCSDADIERSLEEVARSWRGTLSLDLISGLPGQRPGDVRADVVRALEHTPSHVSLYALTLEGGHGHLRAADDADELWLEGREALEERGYRGYEVSNFAPAGAECAHNLRYWRLEPYLGVGPAAVSTLPDGHGGVLRAENTRSLERYLAEPDPRGPAKNERVEPRDFLFETLIMGLRLRDGIEAAAATRRFGMPIPDILPLTWRSWRDRGLLDDSAGRVALEPGARLMLDSLLTEAREEIDTLAPEVLRVRWP